MVRRAIVAVLLAGCGVIAASWIAEAQTGCYPGAPGCYPTTTATVTITRPPPPPPPAARAQKATVALKKGRRFVVGAKGRVTLGTATCPMSAASCGSLRSRLEVPRRPKVRSYGRAALKVKPGQRKTLRVTLTPRARRMLLGRRSLRTRIVIRGATRSPIFRTVTLRRR